MGEIKKGFLVKDGKIFDMNIEVYKLSKEFIDDVLVFSLVPNGYRRLVDFESLLNKYSVSEVLNILCYNRFLKKERELNQSIPDSRLILISNYSTIKSYPSKYLKQKKFNSYKICQKLKQRLS